MSPPPPPAVARLRKLHEAASPGPWAPFDESDGHYGIRASDGTEVARINGYETDANHLSDLEHIAAMRNALPALLDVAELALKMAPFMPCKCASPEHSECPMGYRDNIHALLAKLEEVVGHE